MSALIGALIAAVWAFAGTPAHAYEDTSDDSTSASSAEVELLERYAPIVVVPAQTQQCGPGESYRPRPVEVVLGNPDVVLRNSDGEGITTAPTAANLADAGPEDYLDFPGNPLDPGCDYSTWAALIGADQPQALYGRVATDPDHPDKIVAQYWFWYVFNDWNDKHEGDWEMIQVLFDAPDAEKAMQVEPSAVAFAQHEGSEVSPWDDPKLRREGDRPVVYPGVGSHAAYYDQSQWFGKSAAAGFGCDNTAVSPQTPGERSDPQIVPIPADVSQASGDLSWLQFEGRWGQRAPSFNNGPTGPATKTQWDQPVTWQLAEGRPDAVALPPVPGPGVAAFCAVTSWGSALFVDLLNNPFLTLAGVALLLVLLILGIRATRWKVAEPRVLDRPRRVGQLVTAAAVIVVRRWPGFAVFAVALFIALTVGDWLRELILSAGQSASITDAAGGQAALPLVAASLVTLLVVVPVVAILGAAAMELVSRPGQEVRLSRALREAIAPPNTLVTLVICGLAVSVSLGSLVLAPIGALLLAHWLVAPPAAAVEGLGWRAALARSSQLTRGRRWRTIGFAVLLLVTVTVPGPVIGVLLLLLTGTPFLVVNAIVAAVFAAGFQFGAVALVLQFYDLRQRELAAQRREQVGQQDLE